MSGGDLGGGSGADGPETQAGPLGPREGPTHRPMFPVLSPYQTASKFITKFVTQLVLFHAKQR